MEDTDAGITTNLTNGTNSVQEDVTLKLALESVLIISLVIIILAISCDITPNELFLHVRNPLGVFCGMISQFILMPFSAYILNVVFQLTATYAAGVLILSCCPGGPLSNTFTYFWDGDLALSVTMTTFATLLALGFLPLNMWIYGHSIDTNSLVIPYHKIALTLLYISSPIAVGMLVRWKARRIAYYITKIGSHISVVLIFLCILLQYIFSPSMFDDAPWQLFVAALLLPSLGLSIGYCLSFLFHQSVAVRKTIAMECGIQNAPLALAIVSISFSGKNRRDISAFPALYGFSMIFASCIACLVYQIHKKLFIKKTKGERDTEDAITEPIVAEVEKEDKCSFNAADVRKEMDEYMNVVKYKNRYERVSISSIDGEDKISSNITEQG